MEYLEQVHLFATKWIEKFKDQKISYIELVDHYLADDCQALVNITVRRSRLSDKVRAIVPMA